MRCLNKFIIHIVIVLSIPAAAFAGLNHGVSNQDIYSWVTTKLEAGKDYPMPQIELVSQEKLQKIFRTTNEKSFMRWADRYGKEMADEMIAFYLKEVIGLFIPKTCALYVGNFLEPCKQKSIIAHELVHYIQHMQDGQVPIGSKQAENMHLFREMQAGKIEKDFNKAFCDQDHPN